MTDTKKPAPPPATPNERSAWALERIAAALERLSPPPPPVVDLDDKYGNPNVRFNPRTWKGEDMKGRAFSRTSPEFLEELAPVLDAFASQEVNPKFRAMKRGDAERARGWAERLRAGWKPKAFGAGASAFKPAAFPAAAKAPPAAAPSSSPSARSEGGKTLDYPPDWDVTEDPPPPTSEGLEDLEPLD